MQETLPIRLKVQEQHLPHDVLGDHLEDYFVSI